MINRWTIGGKLSRETLENCANRKYNFEIKFLARFVTTVRRSSKRNGIEHRRGTGTRESMGIGALTYRRWSSVVFHARMENVSRGYSSRVAFHGDDDRSISVTEFPSFYFFFRERAIRTVSFSSTPIRAHETDPPSAETRNFRDTYPFPEISRASSGTWKFV